jgi:hypothetical protein
MGQTTPPRHDIPDTEFTFDHAFGVRVTVSVPWREVRQVLRAPAELGFWLVSTGEFTDLPSLASRLSQPSRPVDVWLAGRLSPSATAALANHQGQGSDPGSLPELLAQDLNRVLRSTARADLQHFAGVALSTDTRRVIERARSGDDLVRLFRRLLEDAYPEELARKPALWLATATNLFAVVNDQAHPVGWPSHYRVNQIALRADGVLFVASSHGLFHFRPHQKDWEQLAVADGFGRAWAVEDVLGVAFDSRGRLWFASKAGAGCQTQDGWKFYEGEDGLPWNDFTCLAPGPDGAMWFGTRLGAIRFDGREWYYRQGPRWLPHDEVRQVAVEPRGRAWFATAGGAGLIEPWPMTLAQKAAFFEEEIARYIKRTTFGYVAETPLRTAGDKTTAHPEDSDHDGLWTALYGAGECFGYAATKDPATKARAQQAFAALRFLQQVTQESSNAMPNGVRAVLLTNRSFLRVFGAWHDLCESCWRAGGIM